MARLRFSDRGHRDFDEIWNYLAESSDRVADTVQDRLLAKCIRLIEHPLSGHPRKEVKPGLRSLNSDGYAIFYRYRAGLVTILRVVHHSRNLTAVDFEDVA